MADERPIEPTPEPGPEPQPAPEPKPAASDSILTRGRGGQAPLPGSPTPVAAEPDQPVGAAPGSDWRAALPDDLKGSKSLARYGDVAALAKAYTELERLKAPGSDTSPEDRQRWAKHIGVPADPTQYLPPPPPAGLPWRPEAVKFSQERFHKAGLMPWQATEMFNLYADYAGQLAQEKAREYGDELKKWEDTLGPELYSQQTTYGARAVEFLDEDLGGALTAYLSGPTNEGNNPILVKAFAKVGELFREHRLIEPDVAGGFGVTDALAEIDRIKADPKHPAHNPEAPGFAAAHERYMALYKLAHGTGETSKARRR